MSDITKTRATDSPFTEPNQSSRFVELSGNWFFMTREYGLQGPYASKADAETAVQGYIAEHAHDNATPTHMPETTLPSGQHEQLANVVPWPNIRKQNLD